MSAYSIHIENGKVIGDSRFYLLSSSMLDRECKRLCKFTDTLDKAPSRKKENIMDYKCAKYRYSAVSLIHSLLYNNDRLRKLRDMKNTCYLMENFCDVLTANPEYFHHYEAAPEDEKPEFSLYYGVRVFIEQKTRELEENLKNADDLERVELEERLEGFAFASTCLDEAWEKRGEASV